MISETIYFQTDLEFGICTSCGEVSNEILKGDGRCLDCIEEEKFYKTTLEMEHPEFKDM
jgi:hypothetical protein